MGLKNTWVDGETVYAADQNAIANAINSNTDALAGGAVGEPGPAGSSVTYKSTVMRVEDLPATANPGDMYWVETPAPTTAFIWDGTTSAFVAAGRVQGDPGADGVDGGPGVTYVATVMQVGDLPATANLGDMYWVETPAPTTAFIWDGTTFNAAGRVQGDAGADGQPGAAGPTGADGAAGPAGADGADGDPGPVGPAGPAGEKGDQGIEGPQGIQGEPGIQGAPGLGITFKGSLPTVDDLPDGATQGDLYIVEEPAPAHGWVWDDAETAFVDAGPVQGPQGIQGEQGTQGIQGESGADGPAGPAGADGADGPTGPKGDTGPPGEQGVAGADGPKGDTGAAGPKGDTGATGPAGPTTIATATTLGAIKVGTGLAVDAAGLLTATGGGGSSIANPVNGSVTGLTMWVGTQAAYDAIATKDAKTVYNVIA